jgi:hypothetical protein
MDAAGMTLAGQLLQQGACQPSAAMLQLLARPAAVAALPSAVAGWVKAWAVGIRSSSFDNLKQSTGAGDTATAGTGADEIAARQYDSLQLVAALASLLGEFLLPCVEHVRAAAETRSSSSSSQVTASERLLLVLVARSLVVLHDALEAAAAAAGMTAAKLMTQSAAWLRTQDANDNCSSSASSSDSSSCTAEQQQQQQPLVHTASLTWQQYQGTVVEVVQQLWKALGQAVIPLRDHQQQQQQQGSQDAVVWPHLLQLHEAPKLVAAAEQLQSKWAASYLQLALQRQRSIIARQMAPEHSQQQQQDASTRIAGLTDDALAFCRVLAAAVPLPEVCNNPSCGCLGGVSEAAVAVKACGGCGARYCSMQCQQGDWRRHKRACRLLQQQGTYRQ